MRLDKLLANMGYGTRKEIKKLLKSGIVTVNGQVKKDGQCQVDPRNDVILFQGERVAWKPYVYIMLNKPRGVVSARQDPLWPTVLDLLDPDYLHYHLFPVGRLDVDTEGLLLITNDGQLSHRLLSPKREVPKVYEVHIDAPLTEKMVDRLQSGVVLDDGYLTKPAQVKVLDSHSPAKIQLTIVEGKFHQVKRMVKAVGRQVLYLKRLKMGPLTLDESLSPGEYRELTDDEIKLLGGDGT